MRRITLGLGMIIVLAALSAVVWRVVRAQAPSTIPTSRWQQTTVDEWSNGTLDGLLVSNNDDGEIRLDRDATEGTYTSAAFESPMSFTAISNEWRGDQPTNTDLQLEFRTSPNGTEWREWQMLAGGRTISSTLRMLGPAGVEPESRWLQYRIRFSTKAQPAVPVVAEASWLFFDASAGPTLSDQPNRVPAAASKATLTQPPAVISRIDWGAFASGPDLSASRPRRLEVVGLSLSADADPPTFIRALQAAALHGGAPDMPYAYLVDSAGNIYQGRLGSADVRGTLSVALLGAISDPARESLAQTLAWLAQTYDLPLSLNVSGGLTPEAAETIRLRAAALTVRSRWLFIQSNTRDYTERLMFFNPGLQAASAIITFLPGQSNAIQRELTIEPGQRVNLIANDIFSDTADLPIEVTANQPIVAERTMLFANDALGEPGISQFSRSWYFAEGDGSDGRSTILHLYNPQTSEVRADVLIISSNNLTRTLTQLLPPRTTVALAVSDDLPAQFGMRVVATAPIAAERTILIGQNQGGGFLTRGAIAPSKTWYFAEGATIEPFVTTLALLNPNPVATAITTTFLTEQGATLTRRYQLPPLSRLTVEMRDIVAAPQGVGAAVTASHPIVAERTTYFNEGRSATNSLGTSELAYTWHFAEGRTTDPATEFLVLANPNSTPAEISLRVGKEDGTSQSFSYTIPRTGRIALLMDELVPFQQSHTTTVESTLPIVAERTILIANDDGGGGHTALGTPER